MTVWKAKENREVRLGDVATMRYGKMPDKGLVREEPSEGHDVPVFSGYRIVGFYPKANIRCRSLVVVCRGVGGTGDVKFTPSKCWLTNLAIVFEFQATAEIDERYLFYFFKVYSLSFLDSGSAQSQITIADLKRLKIPIPPLETQRKIAGVLSAYDDLIENNRRRIAILENMAEEIYREWFVRMRFPGHQNAKFVKGVPEGWMTLPLRKIVLSYIGGGWGQEEFSSTYEAPAYVIRGTDIPSVEKGVVSRVPFRFHKATSLRSRVLRPGDMVFEVSGGSKNQLLGRNVVVTESLLSQFDSPVICASFCKLIRFRLAIVKATFVGSFMKLFHSSGLAGLFQVQSTGISNYKFESFLDHQTLLIPNAELMSEFDGLVRSIDAERVNRSRTNAVLRSTRDALMPRLLSQETRLDKVEVTLPGDPLLETQGLANA